MTRRAFTMLELLVAILILGIMSTLMVLTFNSVVKSWQSSGEYMDKVQRCDYALNQIVSGLKSAWYPHSDGKQDFAYGFMLQNNGDGQRPDDSDVVEWAKTGYAIVGSGDASADSVHRVQVMVLEEGNRDYKEEIRVTGLYARMCPDPKLRPEDSDGAKAIDYTFGNRDLYQPVLVADGVVGFNCRVMKSPEAGGDTTEAETKFSNKKFEDEWESSNAVPYKVELTFWVADPDGRSFRREAAPMMRIVRMPVYEQSLDGARIPTDAKEEERAGGGSRRGGSRSGGGRSGGPGGAGPGGGAPPGGGGPR